MTALASGTTAGVWRRIGRALLSVLTLGLVRPRPPATAPDTKPPAVVAPPVVAPPVVAPPAPKGVVPALPEPEPDPSGGSLVLTARSARQLELLDRLRADALAQGQPTDRIDETRDDLLQRATVLGRTDAPSPAELVAGTRGPGQRIPTNPNTPTGQPQPDWSEPALTTGAIPTSGLYGRRHYGQLDRDELTRRVPPDVSQGVHTLIGCMDPRYHLAKVGLALSGGATHGDFQLGALRYVYDNFLGGGAYPRPDIITGTSVGSVNGTKLSEGAAVSLDELEQRWANQHMNSDTYRMNGSWDVLLRRIEGDLPGVVAPIAVTMFLSGGVPLLPIAAAMFSAGAIGAAAGRWIRQLETIKSLYTMAPIRRLIDQESPYWSPTGPGRRGAGLCAGYDGAGRPLVFVRGYDDGCYVSRLDRDGRWTTWANLGLRLAGDPCVVTDDAGVVTALVVHAESDRRYWLREPRGDGDLASARGWMDWEPLGFPGRIDWRGTQFGGPQVTFDSSPAVARNADGTWFVVGVGLDGWMWRRRVGDRSRHFEWELVGGLPPRSFVGRPGAAVTPGGALHLLTRRLSGRVDSLKYPQNAWNETSGTASSRLTLVASGDGALHGFCRGTDKTVWVMTQGAPDGDWEPWQPIGRIATSNIAAARDRNQRLSIFVRGLDGAIWTKDALATGGWSPNEDWQSLGSPPSVRLLGDPVATCGPDGLRHLYCVGHDRHLYLKHEMEGPDGRPRWTEWHSLGGRVWVGVELRLSAVSLETGNVRYVDEAGRFTDSLDPLVDVADAIMASSAMPVIFEPVVLNGQTYVDGGLRDAIPIWAAINAGAEVVLAIECSAPLSLVQSDPAHHFHDPLLDLAADLDHGFGSSLGNTLTEAGIGAIAMRSVLDVMPNAIVRNQLEPPQPWPVPVYVIQPSMDVHDAMTIDQGLIRIAQAYGWMRASDVLRSSDPQHSMPTSDAIMLARRECWQREKVLSDIIHRTRYPEPGYDRYSWDGPDVVTRVAGIRAAKQRIAAAVAARRGGGFELPGDADTWATQWEYPGLRMSRLVGPDPAAGFSYTMHNEVLVTVPPA